MDSNIQETSNVLIIPFSESKRKYFYLTMKRIVDIFVGLIGTIIVFPMALIIKIAYMLTGDFKPILFVQKRIGKNGNSINIYKFRSMVWDADEKLKEILKDNAKLRVEYYVNKKLENDPRITKIGKFIRKCSIDEFPQFINVLIGNMSLVGPRPYLFREKEDMGNYYNDVIKCKPGITGLWQVSGRSNVSFKYRLQLDRIYAVRRSLLFDFRIAIKTFRAVFGGK